MRQFARGVRSVEDVAWVVAIAAVPITLAALKWLAPAVDGWFEPPAGYTAFPNAGALFFAPEPLEEARFLIAIAIPAAVAGVVLWAGARRTPDSRLDLPIVGFQLAALAFVGWTATKQNTDLLLFPHYVSTADYLPDDLFGVAILVAGVAIGLGLTALLFASPHPGPALRRLSTSRPAGARWLPVTLAVAATIVWLLPAVVTDGNVARAGLLGGHIPIQFEDYLAVVNGRTPLVNFVAQYSSLLPLLSAPLLSLFESSVTAYSLIECVLTLGALLCAYAALVNVARGRWIALALYVPFLAVALVPWHLGGETRIYTALYYAAFPTDMWGRSW